MVISHLRWAKIGVARIALQMHEMIADILFIYFFFSYFIFIGTYIYILHTMVIHLTLNTII